MPNEPERPIEKVLRNAARQRRDAQGGPFELHPATRRLLQGEVSRQFPARTSSKSFFSVFWPRLALGAVVVSAVVLGVFIFFPPGSGTKEQMFAKNDAAGDSLNAPAVARAEPAPVKDESQPTLAPAPAPEAPQKSLLMERVATPARTRQVLAPYGALSNDSKIEPVVITAASSAPVVQGTNSVGQAIARVDRVASPADASAVRRYGLRGGAGGIGAQPPPEQLLAAGRAQPQPAGGEVTQAKPLTFAPDSAPASLVAAELYRAEQQTTDAQAVASAQRFVRVGGELTSFADSRDAFSAANSVMASFKLEQAGQEVRVVDRDGSVYSGVLATSQAGSSPASDADVSARTAAASARPIASEKMSADKTAQTIPGYFFRVSGTNRSLNQKIVFTGTLFPTNVVVTTGRETSPPASTALRKVQLQLPILNSRLSGKLLIGDTQAVDINAVPAKP